MNKILNYADPVVLKGIVVTDAAGYDAPYAAVDTSTTYVENQTAFVVIALEIRPASEDDHIGILDGDGFPTSLGTILSRGCLLRIITRSTA